MLIVNRHIKRISNKLSDIPFLKENSLTVNILLLLGVIIFVVITVDFNTELSVQKDEITQVVGTLNQSINTLHLDASVNIIIKPPCVGIIPPVTFFNSDNDIIARPCDRAPPSLA